MTTQYPISRRQFIQRCGLASAALAGWNSSRFNCLGAEPFAPPVAVFSKVYQELKLTFEESAAITAEAGLDGIDCGVRPRGEIEPAQAADEMPKYAEILAKQKVRMLLLTTGITAVNSPCAETILRTGKKLGIQYYRIGYWRHKPGEDTAKLLAEVKAQLKDLAAMNRELGVCGIYQNHSGSKTKGEVGGDLNELAEIMQDLNPDQIGLAFDLGHALIMHGDDWGTHFEKLKPYIKVAYIKDAKRMTSGFLPFGQGDIGGTDYFKRLRAMNYQAPFSMHIEYDWDNKGANRNRATLLAALKESRQALRRWTEAA